MTLIERYLTWAVLCFVSALIYIFFFMKQTEEKKLSTRQKILYAVFIGLIVPLIIILVFEVVGIGIFTQGE